MIFGALDLNCGAGAICIRGQGENRIDKPLGCRASQQIITPSQIEIACNIGAARAVRTLRRLRERDFPGFVQFSHVKSL